MPKADKGGAQIMTLILGVKGSRDVDSDKDFDSFIMAHWIATVRFYSKTGTIFCVFNSSKFAILI